MIELLILYINSCHPQSCLYLTVYVIEVYTGDKAGAGTDAHVFVTLYGKRGQAPKTQLISRCGDKSIKSSH